MTPYNDTITHWQKSQLDAYGKHAWLAPISIKGRWEQGKQYDNNSEATENNSIATVFLTSNIIHEGDYLALGEYSKASPTDVSEAYQIKKLRISKSLDNSRHRVMAMVGRA